MYAEGGGVYTAPSLRPGCLKLQRTMRMMEALAGPRTISPGRAAIPLALVTCLGKAGVVSFVQVGRVVGRLCTPRGPAACYSLTPTLLYAPITSAGTKG